MTDQRNTLIAIVLSLVILVGWEMFFAPKPVPPQTPTAPATQTATPPDAPVTVEQPADGPPLAEKVSPPAAVPSPGGAPTPDRQTAVASGERIRINTPRLHGSLSLTGLRFDDVTLARFHETPDPRSAEIVLLSPASAPKPYYAENGWIAAEQGVKLPSATTVWTNDTPGVELTPNTPITVSWDNGEGLRFVRTIRVDQDFMFTIEQSVENRTDRAVTLYPYALIARLDTPPTQGFFILHEGPLGVFDGTLKEMKYKDLKEDKRDAVESTGGWIGITDKYWLTAIAFDPAMKVNGSFNYTGTGTRDRYQTDLRGEAVTVAPGETKSVTNHVFAGAKEVQMLDYYEQRLGIARFDLAVDFGWFYFLTKPFFYALLWLKGALGNFGLAILAFTTILRLLIFPLANKQYAAMNKMKALQPEMKRLQERYGSDRVKLNQELMELYKREKANPVAGCLPILIQIPIFFALYKVLFVTIEMRHAPFYGWIKDLSAPDPTNIFNLFGLLPFTPPAFMHLGALPIIMGITMWLQQKLSPQPADPVQAKIMMFLPIIFTFLLASFPAGLVIYWTWSNLLGIVQQWVLMRRDPAFAKAKA